MFLQLTATNFNFSQVGNLNVDTAVFSIVKILFLLGFFLYILFAFLAVRQIEEMRRTVITPLSPIIQVVGYVHLLLAIGAFLFVFMFLS